MIHHLGQLQLVFCWQTHIILHQISTWDLTWEVRPSGLRCRYILLQSAKNSRPQQAWSPSAWMLSAITSDRGKWTQHGTSVEVVWWQKNIVYECTSIWLGFRQPESTIINLRQGCCVCFKRSHLALPWLQPLAGWPPLLTVVSVCFSSLETGYTFGGSIIRSICCNMLYMSISHGELKEKSTSETIPKPPNISNRGNLLIFASKIPIRAKEKTSRSALHLARRSQPAKTPES